MKLLSLSVSNYRVHANREIDLDAPLVLIGGPNESGKSTLAEAAHRALFMKARAATDAQRAMIPLAGGHPRVMLRFEQGGKIHELTKVFSGPRGTISLVEEGGRSWQQAEAETKLAELLGNGIEQANTEKQLRATWSHLWTWQGTAGDNPTGLLASQHGSLVTLLQREGGVAIMQSATDSRLAEAIRAKYEVFFNQHGKVKAGSPLGQALQEFQTATEAKQAAEAAFDKLEDAARRHAEALATEQAARQEEKIAVEHLAAASAKANGVARLSTRLDKREQLANKRTDRLTALRQTSRDILALENQLAALLAEQAAAEQTSATLLAAAAAARETYATTVANKSACAAKATAARQARELATARVDVFEREAVHNQRSQHHAEVIGKKAEQQQAAGELAALLPADASMVRRFRDAEVRLSLAEAALSAMATGIEVVEASTGVRVDDQSLATGASRTITGEAEIRVGTDVLLRIRPGGGNALVDARAARADAKAELQRLRAAHAIASSQEAETIRQQRDAIQNHIATLKAHLRGLGAENSETLLDEAATDLTAARNLANQLQQLLPECPVPDHLDAARAARDAAQAASGLAEAEAVHADQAVQDAQSDVTARENALAAYQKTLGDQAHAITGARAQMGVHLAAHGDRAGLEQAIGLAAARCQRADDCVERTRAKRDAMQPHLVKLDQEQARVAKESAAARLQKALIDKQVAITELKNDGTLDPSARRAEAVENFRRAEATLGHLQQRADAIAHLYQTFTAEREALATRYTAPLAGKIRDYLSCLFGPDCRVNVRANDDHTGFSEFAVIRPLDGAGEMPFDALSGGAKEQIEAAIRLAAAEVLASEHGGCLPVIFDDAFAFTDSTRNEGVHRMLFLARTRGLQVIVLACNPRDYAGLGAKVVTITREHAPAPGPIRPREQPSPGEDTAMPSSTGKLAGRGVNL